MCVTHWFVRPEHALWRHKQRRKKRPAVCCRPDACTGRGAQQGVANGSLPVSHNRAALLLPFLTVSLLCCALGCFVCLTFSSPLQFGHRSFVSQCAHAESSTHACIAPRVAAVTRSESVARAHFAARCRVVARKVPTVAWAELGSILDPDNDLWRFGHARVVIITVV